MKALVLLTRCPYGPKSGRKAVLNTAIDMLSYLGYKVDVVVLSKCEGMSEGSYKYLGKNSFFSVLVGFFSFLFNKKSFNEVLYYSRKREKVINERLSKGYDLVFCDMIRCAQFLTDYNGVCHVDLDDLLSRRYLGYSNSLYSVDQFKSMLGIFKDYFPRVFYVLIFPFAKWFLLKEHKILESKEVLVANRFSSCSLVSPIESRFLSSRSGQYVWSLPMAMDAPFIKKSTDEFDRNRAVFVGSMDYEPNLNSILYFEREFVPRLTEDDYFRYFSLSVIGNRSGKFDSGENLSMIDFLGYVDNLFDEVVKYSYYFAPISAGTGIKTKILEAFALGIPVITTPMGISGLDVQHGVHCFVVNNFEEFKESVLALEASSITREALSLNARHFVEENFSSMALRRSWSQLHESAWSPASEC